jgi:three-Cys-motif partner protein
MVSLGDYAGREQAYVKHVFLERYLEALVFKTASAYNHIVYVNGFAGPWQSANEQFEDTSFGIALNALCRAKETWKNSRRLVKMTALLVERDAKAYERLATITARYPDVTVKTYPTDFISVVPSLLKDIPADDAARQLAAAAQGSGRGRRALRSNARSAERNARRRFQRKPPPAWWV